jgi:outer membrane biosynthesis protein TonB
MLGFMTARQYGILGTIILHNIIILILLFTFLSLPRPVPSEGGILINFGDVESAGGPAEPRMNESPASPPQASQSASESEEGILTQDFEEAPVVKKTPEKKTAQKAQDVVKPAPVNTKTTPAAPVEKPRTVNTKALYSNKGQSTTTAGTSEGIYKGTGNMGDPTGTPESDNYSEGLGGSGIVSTLAGRNPIHLQKPEFTIQKEGTVVVEITVDRTGKVIGATPGVKGSNIVDNTLYAAAKKAALASKFNLKNDAPERQIGNIIYHFKLQ